MKLKKKSINRRAKGQRTQRKIIKILEVGGAQVGIVERSGRFIKEKDLLGLFDLVSFSSEGIKFIQCKTNSTGGFIKKLKEFRKKYDFKDVSYELWVKIDYKGFKVWEF